MAQLAWPAAVVIIAIAAFMIFKQPLTRLIDRSQKIGKEGILAELPRQTATAELKPSPADELLKMFDNRLLVEREESIKAELDQRRIQGPERERVLIRLLTAVALVLEFEKTYHAIWGSQLSALQHLNTAGAAGVKATALKPWYDNATQITPLLYTGYTFDQWLGFMKTPKLILQTGEVVVITKEGREFLRFLIEKGYSLQKQG